MCVCGATIHYVYATLTNLHPFYNNSLKACAQGHFSCFMALL